MKKHGKNESDGTLCDMSSGWCRSIYPAYIQVDIREVLIQTELPIYGAKEDDLEVKVSRGVVGHEYKTYLTTERLWPRVSG